MKPKSTDVKVVTAGLTRSECWLIIQSSSLSEFNKRAWSPDCKSVTSFCKKKDTFNSFHEMRWADWFELSIKYYQTRSWLLGVTGNYLLNYWNVETRVRVKGKTGGDLRRWCDVVGVVRGADKQIRPERTASPSTALPLRWLNAFWVTDRIVPSVCQLPFVNEHPVNFIR